MRVALNFAAIGAQRGGAEKYVGVLARTLAAAGHEVHVLAAAVDDGELPEGVQVHMIRTRNLPGSKWLRPYLFAAASARELARGKFDLVVGFSSVWRQDVCIAVNGCRDALLESSGTRFRSPAKRARWWLGKMASPRGWVLRWIERKQFRERVQPLVIAPSHRVADDFRRWYGLDEERMAVVHLGIELKRSADGSATRHEFRRQNGLGADDVAFLFAARNYSLKGIDPLLEAFVPVARACPRARLIVCGSDRDRRERQRATRLGLDGRVQFLGFVQDARACFSGADVFVSPTFYDTCSLVVLEALAAGLPVITTRANGASELLTEGVDGFVVDTPWSLDQLADRMQRLASDAKLRLAMGQAARDGAPRLSIEASLQKTLDVLVASQRRSNGEIARGNAA